MVKCIEWWENKSHLNRSFFRTQLMNRPLKFKSSNQSFKTDLAQTMLFFCVEFVSVLFYFINVSVIQYFVPFRFSLLVAFLSFSFLDQRGQLSLLPRLEITVFSKNITVNVKLIHNSGLGLCFFLYEVDYRSTDVA